MSRTPTRTQFSGFTFGGVRLDGTGVRAAVLMADLIFPNVGCLVQEKLGIRGCPAFSIEAACSGFLYSLIVADQFVRSGQAKRGARAGPAMGRGRASRSTMSISRALSSGGGGS